MSAPHPPLAPPPTPNCPGCWRSSKTPTAWSSSSRCPTASSARRARLGLDPLDAQIRQVFFFDTPELALFHSGLVVRARRVQKRGDDSVVKLRPVVPSELPDGVRHAEAFNVEVDAMPGGFVCSGSMKAALGTGDPVREALAGARPRRKLFTKEQRALLAAARAGRLTVDDLVVMGPIFVLKLKLMPKELKRRVVVEMWLYPDNSTLLELSTKCLPRKRSTSRPPPAPTSPSAAWT